MGQGSVGDCFFCGGVPAAALAQLRALAGGSPSLPFPSPVTSRETEEQAGGRGSDGEAAGKVAASLSAGTLPTATG